MKIGYLDCFAGMSSSRLIGALASAGVPEQVLHDAVDALDIGARLELVQIKRNNIATLRAQISINSILDTLTDTTVNVSVQERTPYYELPTFIQSRDSQNHSIHDSPNPVMDQQIHWLGTIQALIGNASLPQRAKELALTTFMYLAEAEAKVCGLPIEEICFHKVKALNTIVGITVCCVGCTWLEVDQWYASPINVGSGILRHPQGSLPIPTPTTLELLGNQPSIFASGPQKELLTATCAALMKSLNVRYTACPPLTISRIGYGAGRIEYDSLPNFLRICIGTTGTGKRSVTGRENQTRENQARENHSVFTETVILEAELANIGKEAEEETSQQENRQEVLQKRLAEMQESLYEYGARLLYFQPVSSPSLPLMGKLVISVQPDRVETVRMFLFQKLDILHLHWRLEKYDHLVHYDEYVQSPWGRVKLRIGQLLDNQLISVVPDMETCQEIARKQDLPVDQVVETVKRLFISIKNQL